MFLSQERVQARAQHPHLKTIKEKRVETRNITIIVRFLHIYVHKIQHTKLYNSNQTTCWLHGLAWVFLFVVVLRIVSSELNFNYRKYRHYISLLFYFYVLSFIRLKKTGSRELRHRIWLKQILPLKLVFLVFYNLPLLIPK